MFEQAQNNALSVSELNRQAKILLESHFDFVTVEGEIGQFTAASSGHWYFNLKDQAAQVRCAMFKRANMRVKLRPKVGDLVRIRARVSLYEGRGEYQLIVEHMAPAGDGALQLAFEQLKLRLAAEGLFDPQHKKPVPNNARCVGVVTSANAAALQDIITVMGRRSPSTEIIVFPVPVQGDGAATQIAAAIREANERTASGELPLDLLIVGRGGGSLEDLWAFNEEVVARAIHESHLPVVSAVGHEVDFSIADFVADVRAPTPSAAAELVTTDQTEWFQHLDRVAVALTRGMERVIRRDQTKLNHFAIRLKHPGHRIERQAQQLAQLKRQLTTQINRHLKQSQQELSVLNQRLQRQKPGLKIDSDRKRLDQIQSQLKRLIKQRLRTEQVNLVQLQRRLRSNDPGTAITAAASGLAKTKLAMNRAIQRRLQLDRAALEQHRRLLQSLSPLNTLERGYAIVTNENGKAMTDARDAEIGAQVSIKLKSGELGARVETRRTEDSA